MAKIQKKILSLEHLRKREQYLEEQLKSESDTLIKLDLVQALVNNKELIRDHHLINLLPRKRLSLRRK